MNNKLPLHDVVAQLAAWVAKNAAGPAEQSALVRQLADTLADTLRADAATGHITAPNAVVEVVDAATGALYRRYLELEYEETDNGVRLLGENMAGAPAQVVFLSETALEKMHGLRGRGPDKPRCKDG